MDHFWLFLESAFGMISFLEFTFVDFFFCFLDFLVFWAILNLFGQFGAILGVVLILKTVLGSTHIVEHISFYMLSSILPFEFD